MFMPMRVSKIGPDDVWRNCFEVNQKFTILRHNHPTNHAKNHPFNHFWHHNWCKYGTKILFNTFVGIYLYAENRNWRNSQRSTMKVRSDESFWPITFVEHSFHQLRSHSKSLRIDVMNKYIEPRSKGGSTSQIILSPHGCSRNCSKAKQQQYTPYVNITAPCQLCNAGKYYTFNQQNPYQYCAFFARPWISNIVVVHAHTHSRLSCPKNSIDKDKRKI